MPQFYNPYAFVPAPARHDDGEPAPVLGALTDGRWSGRLRVRVTARTPLLVTEQDDDRRRTRTVGGAVALPATSLKGMIRSEYETITKSRFGVFDPHDRRLGHRIGAAQRGSADLLPVRVDPVGDQLVAYRLDGRRIPEARTTLPAAWVPRYHGPVVNLPEDIRHGTLVHAWAIPMLRSVERNGQWLTFAYWRVISIGRQRHASPTVDVARHARAGRGKRHEVLSATPTELRGFYVETGRNIETKHDERLFFHPNLLDGKGPPRTAFDDVDNVRAEWGDLIASYRAAKPDEPADGLEYSRHLRTDGVEGLPGGTFAYAELTPDKERIARLYPVAISRKLFDVSPRSLADRARITPATTRDELSPADRLFGWVAPDGRRDDRPSTRPLRGRVRLGAVETITAKVLPVGKGLAILGQPRPTQDLFYAAQDPNGARLRESPGYRQGGGLRGRKVYPHQPSTTFDLNQRRQSWLLHGTGEEPGPRGAGVTSQNSRLEDMVAKGAVFECDLHLENLTELELGALLRVLAGPEPATVATTRLHKLGGGKPLGFGSVTVEVLWERSEVRDTASWRGYFSLDDDDGAGRVLDAVTGAATVESAGLHLDKDVLRHYEAYLAGFPGGLRVHYPADPMDPTSDKERFRWFVANRQGPRKTLGSLTDPNGPALPGEFPTEGGRRG